MKTIKIKIDCGESNCNGVDIKRQCRFIVHKRLGKYTTGEVVCGLFGSDLAKTGKVDTNTESFIVFYRCEECKEAELKGGD